MTEWVSRLRMSIHRANHPEVAYRGGQDPIVHLEADLGEVVDWANASQRRWAFTPSNAGAAYAQFRAQVDRLHEVSCRRCKRTTSVLPT